MTVGGAVPLGQLTALTRSSAKPAVKVWRVTGNLLSCSSYWSSRHYENDERLSFPWSCTVDSKIACGRYELPSGQTIVLLILQESLGVAAAARPYVQLRGVRPELVA